jgi:hypothetical protein
MSSISIDRLNAALEGRYGIEREVGSGGMATVFLADDERHARKVALKVLRPELVAVMGGERFLGEIRTTANLQHPHILPLFDSGEVDGFLYFVMPFIEGETLRELIDREKQLPVDQAVAIGAKVAQALGYAHRHGVVHRDIKPANILLHDGEPVVADFGIALAVQEAGGGRLTETGLSLGTPFYMSPEQATGDRVPDARSDVYSLGTVLYEMLTGEPPFQGTTAQSVLGRILTSDVAPPTEVRKSIPPHVSAVVMRALERLPADRFATAGEMASALGDRSFRHGEEASAAVKTRGAAGARVWRPLAVASTTLAVVLATALTFGGGDQADVADPLVLTISFPDGVQLLTPEAGSPVEISEDGSTIAFIGLSDAGRRIFVRGRGELAPRAVPNTSDARVFFLSPTGDEIAFMVGGEHTLRAVATETGVLRTLTEPAGDLAGDWTADDWIYFRNGSNGISRVPSVGGDAQQITGEAGEVHAWVDALPGGDAALLAIWGSSGGSDSIAVVDLRTGEVERRLEGTRARYLESGHIVYTTVGGQLVVVPFDAQTLEITGPELTILEGVGTGANGEGEFSLSRNGTLVYRLKPPITDVQLAWVDADGVRDLVDPDFDGEIGDPVLSPDGTTVAFTQDANGRVDLWTKRLDRRGAPPQRLTVEGDGEEVTRPAWSHDGRTIYYVDAGRSIVARSANGSGPSRVVLSGFDAQEVQPSPDGEWLIVRTGTSNRDVVAFRINDDETIDPTPVPVAATPFDERAPAVSPEGRWVAYLSSQSGRPEVYVRSFPDTTAVGWRITGQGATEPRWGRDSTELFYRSAGKQMVRVTLDFQDGVRATEAEELFDVVEYQEDINHWEYAVADDGRFLTIWLGTARSSEMVWIENFDDLVRRRFAEVARSP